jgi:hypothetical protein
MSDTFTVKLPKQMKPALEAEAREQGFKSVAAYVAHLVRANGTGPIPYENNPELEAALLEGLRSEPQVADDAYWKRLRKRVRKVVSARRRKRA